MFLFRSCLGLVIICVSVVVSAADFSTVKLPTKTKVPTLTGDYNLVLNGKSIPLLTAANGKQPGAADLAKLSRTLQPALGSKTYRFTARQPYHDGAYITLYDGFQALPENNYFLLGTDEEPGVLTLRGLRKSTDRGYYKISFETERRYTRQSLGFNASIVVNLNGSSSAGRGEIEFDIPLREGRYTHEVVVGLNQGFVISVKTKGRPTQRHTRLLAITMTPLQEN